MSYIHVPYTWCISIGLSTTPMRSFTVCLPLLLHFVLYSYIPWLFRLPKCWARGLERLGQSRTSGDTQCVPIWRRILRKKVILILLWIQNFGIIWKLIVLIPSKGKFLSFRPRCRSFPSSPSSFSSWVFVSRMTSTTCSQSWVRVQTLSKSGIQWPEDLHVSPCSFKLGHV